MRYSFGSDREGRLSPGLEFTYSSIPSRNMISSQLDFASPFAAAAAATTTATTKNFL